MVMLEKVQNERIVSFYLVLHRLLNDGLKCVLLSSQIAGFSDHQYL